MAHTLKPPLPEDLHSNAPIDCPKCHGPMKHIRVGEVVADRCNACSGLWLDTLEKEKLLASKGAAKAVDTGGHIGAAAHPAKHRLLCPRDKSTLIHMHDPRQPHVAYESCTVCGGVFLDAGELKDLSEMTLRERLLGKPVPRP